MSGVALEYKALEFATRAHASIQQVRKYTGVPYILHPISVANFVRTVAHTPEMIAAAYLHDVVEDTPVELHEIHAAFGPIVGNLVDWLTDISKPSDGNRKVRKAIDRQHTWDAPAEAQTIKLADLLDNTVSIVRFDPSFAKVYLAEKKLLLEGMTKGDLFLKSQCEEVAGVFHGW